MNDTVNTFAGWKTLFKEQNSWVQYNSVDFGRKKFKKVDVKAQSVSGGSVQIRLDKIDGPVIAEISIPKANEWKTLETKVSNTSKGTHNLFIVLKDSSVEIDWIRFKN